MNHIEYNSKLQKNTDIDVLIINSNSEYQSKYKLEKYFQMIIKDLLKTFDEWLSCTVQISCKIDSKIIAQSKIIIFCLTNTYFQSNEFKLQLQTSRKFNRIVMFMLLEPINDLILINQFQNLPIYTINDTINNINEILFDYCFRISYFTSFYFGKQNEIKYSLYKNLKDQSYVVSNVYSRTNHNFISIEFDKQIKLASSDHAMFKLFSIEENNHLLCWVYNSMDLFIYHNTSFKLIKKLNYQIGHLIVFIKHLSLLCLINIDKTLLYLLDKDYKLVEIKPIKKELSVVENIVYDSVSQQVYLITNVEIIVLNDKFEVHQRCYTRLRDYQRVIGFYNSRLYLVESQCIHVYDAYLNYLTVFGQLMLNQAVDILFDRKHIYIIDLYGFLNIFDSMTYSYLTKLSFPIAKPTDRSFLVNGRLIVINSNMLRACKMNINDNRVLIERYFDESNSDQPVKYICRLDVSRKHICKNPYELPCGNIACLECIYDNYNPYLNQLRCDFETCNSLHVLKIDSIKKSNVIECYLCYICKKLITYPVESIINSGIFYQSDF